MQSSVPVELEEGAGEFRMAAAASAAAVSALIVVVFAGLSPVDGGGELDKSADRCATGAACAKLGIVVAAVCCGASKPPAANKLSILWYEGRRVISSRLLRSNSSADRDDDELFVCAAKWFVVWLVG